MVAMLGLFLPVSRPSWAAYREAHATAHDMRARIDEAGVAQMEHAITYRVMAGSLTSIDLAGIEPNAAIESEAIITSEDGRTYPGQATLQPPTGDKTDASLHVDVLDKKGLRRGTYVVKVRYRLDLVAEKAIAKDLALWRIAWTSPSLPEGIDGERVVFDLPAAPTEPRPWRADGSEGDGVVSTLRRSANRDELEMVRPHVARGERVTWGARIDPKAFPAVRSPDLRPQAAAPGPTSDRLHEGLRTAFAALAGLLFALVVAKKNKRTAELYGREKVTARPLLPLAPPLRIAAAGSAAAACIALQLAGSATWSGVLLACAMFAAAHRAPRVILRPRGPGSWSTVREREAFAMPPREGDTFDASTRRGKITLALMAALTAGAAFAADRYVGRAASYLVILDALVLVPLFFTGTRAQLPPPLPQASAPWLKSLFNAMKKHVSALRVVAWARHPVGSDVHDELRLLVLPRASMPGVIGIEIGATWPGVPDGPYLSPEVLVRVHDASAAAAKLLSLAPHERPLPGRRLHERVVRLVPEIPTLAATRALVLSLVTAFVDRRVAAPAAAWKGLERRLPPGQRAQVAQGAAGPAA